ncbi:MAG: isoprenyl synthetase [Cytophagaceae bacterium SCN 52-12]|nr:MAG: isoprenyl synthetase [Cytophagaceae bacterium SCN 52-12]
MSQIEVLKAALDKEIAQHPYGLSPVELYEPIQYLMDLQGKRLRPLLTLLSVSLFSDNWKEALQPAHAVEVFHNFTLMHDDIMDNAPVRRGSPTVHMKWNENTAILSGDVMLVKAYELFLNLPADMLPEVLRRFSRTAAEVCEGQQLDMNFETARRVSIADYIEMIRLKTSVLLGFALELGALIGRADRECTKKLYEAGVNMGLGFQLMDDLLDVYGDPEKFGKQVGGDIISNKKTYLYLKALELGGQEVREELTALFSGIPADGSGKIKKVTGIYNDLNIKEITGRLIESYFDKAIEAIGSLPVDDDRKQQLLTFIVYLMNRDR